MGKGDESKYRSESFNALQGFGQTQMGWQSSLMDAFNTQFQGQQNTLSFLQKSLGGALSPGQYTYNPHDPFYRDNGDGTVTNTQTGQQMTKAQAGQAQAGGGGGQQQQQGLQMSDFPSGFNEGDFNVRYPGAGLRQLYKMQQSQVMNQTGDEYGDSLAATQRKMAQMGGPGLTSGASAQLMAQNDLARAKQESQGLLQAGMDYMQMKNQNSQQYSQELLQAGIAKANERMQNAKMVGDRMMQLEQMRQAQKSREASVRAQAAAVRAYQQGQSVAQRQAAFQFSEQMRLAGAQLQSENWRTAIGALGGIAQQQNPLGYVGGAQGFGNQSLNAYSTQWNRTVPQNGGFFGNLAKGLLGGAANFFTGGLLSGGGLGGMFGGGGGGDTMNYSNGSPPGGGSWWGE